MVFVGRNLKFLESVWSQALSFMSVTPFNLVYHQDNFFMFIVFPDCEKQRKTPLVISQQASVASQNFIWKEVFLLRDFKICNVS